VTAVRAHAPTVKSKIRFVYVLAASHSGSTLLAMLLGSHPDICTVGELKLTALGDVERYRCSCREEIRSCPFWRSIAEDMGRRGMPFDVGDAGTELRSGASRYVSWLLGPLHRGPALEWARDVGLALSPTWRARLARFQERNAILAECICARTGKSVIVDSSKIGLRLKFLLRNPALDVRVVRLVRDGRGVGLAYMDPARFADATDPHLRGGGAGGCRESERLSIAAAALEWRRSNEEADAILGRLDRSQWIEIRYEALCAEPESTLQQLAAFIGVPSRQIPRDFRAFEHHVIGNGMRLDCTSDVRLDERWRTAMPAEDLAVFEAVAGTTKRRLGYR